MKTMFLWENIGKKNTKDFSLQKNMGILTCRILHASDYNNVIIIWRVTEIYSNV
jgi:hypothetical protein